MTVQVKAEVALAGPFAVPAILLDGQVGCETVGRVEVEPLA